MVVAGQVIIEIKGEIKDIKKSLEEVKKGLADTKKQTEKSGESVDSLKKSFGSLNTVALAAKSIFASFAVRELYDFIKSSTEASQRLQTFNLIAGETANTLMTNLRGAAGGTVSDMQLMSASMRALALGIDQSQLPELLEVARARAKLMGITTTQAFNDIAIGIGRQSRMILDNLGIVLNMDKIYKDYAKTLGKTVETLTDYEKKMAITNAITRENTGLTEIMNYGMKDSKELLDAYGASFKNIYGEIQIAMGRNLAMQMLEKQAKEENMSVDWDIIDQIEIKKAAYVTLTQQLGLYKQQLDSTKASIMAFSVGSFMLPGEMEMKGQNAALNKEGAFEELAGLKIKNALKARGVEAETLHDYYGGLGKGDVVDEGTVNLLKLYEIQKGRIEEVRNKQRESQLEYTAEISTTKDLLQLQIDMEKQAFEDTIKTQEEIIAVWTGLKQSYADTQKNIEEINNPENPGSLPALLSVIKELETHRFIPITFKITVEQTVKGGGGRGGMGLMAPIANYLQQKLNATGG